MPFAKIESIRMARLIVTRIGMSGTYSSPMPIEYAPKLKITNVPPIRIQGLAPSRSTDLCRAASIAPVSRRIAMTPPAMKMRKMMSWAAAKPFGMASRSLDLAKALAVVLEGNDGP